MDFEQLKEESEKAKAAKGWLGLAGEIGQDMASVPSSYELLTGRKTKGPNVAGVLGKLSETISDPAESMKKELDMRKTADEMKTAKDLSDPNSTTSKAFKAYAISKGWVSPQDAANMSGKDVLAFGDPKKIREIEANADVDMRKLQAAQGFNAQRDAQQRAFEAEQKRLDRQNQIDLKKVEDEAELGTTFGMARNRDDAKKLKEAGELKAKLDAQISELIALREAKGAELLNRDVVGRAKQLSKDLLLTKKNLETLGVLSQSDLDIVNEIIPSDPTQFNFSQLFGQDPTLTKLKAFKKDTERDFQEKLKTRLRPSSFEAVQQGPQGAAAKVDPETRQAALLELQRRQKMKEAANRGR